MKIVLVAVLMFVCADINFISQWVILRGNIGSPRELKLFIESSRLAGYIGASIMGILCGLAYACDQRIKAIRKIDKQ